VERYAAGTCNKTMCCTLDIECNLTEYIRVTNCDVRTSHRKLPFPDVPGTGMDPHIYMYKEGSIRSTVRDQLLPVVPVTVETSEKHLWFHDVGMNMSKTHF